MPGLDHDHPTRQPRRAEFSIYSGVREVGEFLVALGAWPAAASCPCGCTRADDDCEECETFRCPRCERWCSWEMGGADSQLCDDCAAYLEVYP